MGASPPCPTPQGSRLHRLRGGDSVARLDCFPPRGEITLAAGLPTIPKDRFQRISRPKAGSASRLVRALPIPPQAVSSSDRIPEAEAPVIRFGFKPRLVTDARVAFTMPKHRSRTGHPQRLSAASTRSSTRLPEWPSPLLGSGFRTGVPQRPEGRHTTPPERQNYQTGERPINLSIIHPPLDWKRRPSTPISTPENAHITPSFRN